MIRLPAIFGAIFSAALWLTLHRAVPTLTNPSPNLWPAILVLSLILSTSLPQSILREKLSGQPSLDKIAE